MLVGWVGLDPVTVDWMTLREVQYAFGGFEMRRKDEWERALIVANSFSGAGLTYDQIMSGGKAPKTITPEEIAEDTAMFDQMINRNS